MTEEKLAKMNKKMLKANPAGSEGEQDISETGSRNKDSDASESSEEESRRHPLQDEFENEPDIERPLGDQTRTYLEGYD